MAAVPTSGVSASISYPARNSDRNRELRQGNRSTAARIYESFTVALAARYHGLQIEHARTELRALAGLSSLDYAAMCQAVEDPLLPASNPRSGPDRAGNWRWALGGSDHP